MLASLPKPQGILPGQELNPAAQRALNAALPYFTEVSSRCRIQLGLQQHWQALLRQNLQLADLPTPTPALHCAAQQVSTSEKAMRNTPLPPDIMPALLAEAEAIVDATGSKSAPVKAENGVAAFDSAAAAEMAAGWCRTFAAVPRFGSTADYGLSGLAAAVILSSSPRSPVFSSFLFPGSIGVAIKPDIVPRLATTAALYLNDACCIL